MRDIPWLSHARDDEDQGSPCPEDGDFFDARPDAAETEEDINKLISGLDSQQQAGFDRLHTLLSRLPVPVTTNGSKLSHTAALDRAFFPKWIRLSRRGLRLLSSYCTSTQWNTGK